MLNLWNDLDRQGSDVDGSTFQAKTDLWVSVVAQTNEESSGTAAFTKKALEHLALISETEAE